MSQKIKSVFLAGLPAIVIATLLVVTIIYAWTEPSSAPPAGNVSAPINVSTTTQYKGGALGIGGLFRAYSSALFHDIVLDPLSATPTTPSVGQLYFDNNSKNFKYYDGSAWQQFGPGLTASEKALLCDKDTDTYLDNRCSGGTDCNDNDAKIKPGATEICDNIDNDCDTKVDGINRSCTDVCGPGTETCTAGNWGACGGNSCDYSPGCSPTEQYVSCGPDGGGSRRQTRSTACCGGCTAWGNNSNLCVKGFTLTTAGKTCNQYCKELGWTGEVGNPGGKIIAYDKEFYSDVSNPTCQSGIEECGPVTNYVHIGSDQSLNPDCHYFRTYEPCRDWYLYAKDIEFYCTCYTP